MQITKYETDNMFVRIKASYINEDSVVLSPKEQDKKERLVKIWGLRLNNKYSPHQVVEIIIRDYKVSRATAYRDYHWAMELFGDIDKTNKAAQKMVLAESYWNIYQMSLKKDNLEQARKALDSYRGLFNFDEDENGMDPDKIKAHEYHIRVPRRLFKGFDKMFQEGVSDFNDFEIEEADFVEMSKEEDEDGE
jgi:hypothetical protein